MRKITITLLAGVISLLLIPVLNAQETTPTLEEPMSEASLIEAIAEGDTEAVISYFRLKGVSPSDSGAISAAVIEILGRVGSTDISFTLGRAAAQYAQVVDNTEAGVAEIVGQVATAIFSVTIEATTPKESAIATVSGFIAGTTAAVSELNLDSSIISAASSAAGVAIVKYAVSIDLDIDETSGIVREAAAATAASSSSSGGTDLVEAAIEGFVFGAAQTAVYNGLDNNQIATAAGSGASEGAVTAAVAAGTDPAAAATAAAKGSTKGAVSAAVATGTDPDTAASAAAAGSAEGAISAAVATGSDVSAISAASSTGSEAGLTEATGGTADGGSEISLPPPVISPDDVGVIVVSPEDGDNPPQ